VIDRMQSKPRLHPDARLQKERGQVVVLVGGQVSAFEDDQGPSEVAQRIVALADGTRTLSEIVDRLCEEFDVARDVCAQDTLAFVRELVLRRVLVF
jgi:hypothetical protein